MATKYDECAQKWDAQNIFRARDMHIHDWFQKLFVSRGHNGGGIPSCNLVA